MPKWITSDQSTPEWLQARVGCLTASKMYDAMSTTKAGKEAEVRKKYKMQLVAERLTNLLTTTFVNAAMQRGIDEEPAAKERFEEITGKLITPCGFALHDDIAWCGASPDGLVGKDALIEIKNPNTETHLDYLLAGEPPDRYKAQMLLQLAVTKREFCYFMSYDSRLKKPHDAMIVEFRPTAEQLAEVEAAARQFLAETEELMQQLKGAA